MLRCVELLEGNQLVREHYNDRFKYVLVDEFQDTDSLQFRLIKALCPPKQPNACVFCVGDDDQSIYAFRGAKVGNMSDFVKEYKVEKIIKLEQNYRSTSHILDGANAVIANNKDRMGKNLWTDAGAGEPIRLYRADADMQEARAVVQDILVEKRRGKKYSDFAILYRNNNLSRNFERMLSANGIPYRVYGGLRFLIVRKSRMWLPTCGCLPMLTTRVCFASSISRRAASVPRRSSVLRRWPPIRA